MITLNCFCFTVDSETGDQIGDAERLELMIDPARIESLQPAMKERRIMQAITMVVMHSGDTHHVEETVEEVEKMRAAAVSAGCDHDWMPFLNIIKGQADERGQVCNRCGMKVTLCAPQACNHAWGKVKAWPYNVCINCGAWKYPEGVKHA